MVNMMEADVAGEPLQYLGQFIVGTSLESGQGILPVPILRPISFLKLVLDKKQPCAYRRPNDSHRQVNQQKGLPAEEIDYQGNRRDQSYIRPPDAGPFFLPGFAFRMWKAKGDPEE